jgi:hypothetical protein
MASTSSFPLNKLAVVRRLLGRSATKLLTKWRSTILWAGVLIATAYVIGYPFFLATYPPITDLPLHGTDTSILRHFFDPAYHFREQFELHFLEMPYATQYFLGAFFAVFLPITWATKLTAAMMLLLLPAGLAVLFHGMKKSPLWGVLGLGFVWCSLTHWGFLNFLGAIGLFTMCAGFTLLVLDRPTRSRQIWLGGTLAAIFVTHFYRFPFALATVVGIAVVMYPATRKWKPLLAPLAAALTLFGLWLLVKKSGLSGSIGPIALHRERLAEIPEYLFSAFVGPEESEAATEMLWLVGGLFVLTAGLFFLQGRHRGRHFRSLWWGAGVTVLPLLIGSAFLLAYLILPMSIGPWWFVYPREVTTAAYVALGAMPDLPKAWWLRLPLLAVFAVISGRMAFITATHWHEFQDQTQDFRAIKEQIPRAPKLMFLIFDHSGSARRVSPYVHLPAWVQAEKGGWLSWHPAVTGDLHPIRYRRGADNPPPVPLRWEWTPERFDLRTNGTYFDTFLVRSFSAPDHLFAADRSIRSVAHVGRWWLYRRDRPAPFVDAAQPALPAPER